jgi:hypothetical protein
MKTHKAQFVTVDKTQKVELSKKNTKGEGHKCTCILFPAEISTNVETYSRSSEEYGWRKTGSFSVM